jgi:hypothetical protein
MAEHFRIPPDPIQDERGFTITPVMPIMLNNYRNCTVCNGGCRPDRHHAYWPKPPNKKIKKKTLARLNMYGQLPDYSVDPYDRLRSAPFSISGPVRRGWHSALHKLQKPPKELPDREIAQLALEQYHHIITMGGHVMRLNKLIENVKNPAMTKGIDVCLELVRLGIVNFPREIVIPTKSYLILQGDDEAKQVYQTTFDPDSYLMGAQIALEGTTELLNSSN